MVASAEGAPPCLLYSWGSDRRKIHFWKVRRQKSVTRGTHQCVAHRRLCDCSGGTFATMLGTEPRKIVPDVPIEAGRYVMSLSLGID